eukprot:445274-Prymnesium_polylepis.1
MPLWPWPRSCATRGPRSPARTSATGCWVLRSAGRPPWVSTREGGSRRSCRQWERAWAWTWARSAPARGLHRSNGAAVRRGSSRSASSQGRVWRTAPPSAGLRRANSRQAATPKTGVQHWVGTSPSVCASPPAPPPPHDWSHEHPPCVARLASLHSADAVASLHAAGGRCVKLRVHTLAQSESVLEAALECAPADHPPVGGLGADEAMGDALPSPQPPPQPPPQQQQPVPPPAQ